MLVFGAKKGSVSVAGIALPATMQQTWPVCVWLPVAPNIFKLLANEEDEKSWQFLGGETYLPGWRGHVMLFLTLGSIGQLSQLVPWLIRWFVTNIT